MTSTATLRRQHILERLQHGPARVADLARALGAKPSLIQDDLEKLRDRGLATHNNRRSTASRWLAVARPAIAPPAPTRPRSTPQVIHYTSVGDRYDQLRLFILEGLLDLEKRTPGPVAGLRVDQLVARWAHQLGATNYHRLRSEVGYAVNQLRCQGYLDRVSVTFFLSERGRALARRARAA